MFSLYSSMDFLFCYICSSVFIFPFHYFLSIFCYSAKIFVRVLLTRHRPLCFLFFFVNYYILCFLLLPSIQINIFLSIWPIGFFFVAPTCICSVSGLTLFCSVLNESVLSSHHVDDPSGQTVVYDSCIFYIILLLRIIVIRQFLLKLPADLKCCIIEEKTVPHKTLFIKFPLHHVRDNYFRVRKLLFIHEFSLTETQQVNASGRE